MYLLTDLSLRSVHPAKCARNHLLTFIESARLSLIPADREERERGGEERKGVPDERRGRRRRWYRSRRRMSREVAGEG